MSNTPKIGDRIAILKSELKFESNSELEKGKNWPKERLLSNGLITDWLDKPIGWSSDKLEKFLNHYCVNREWWKTGEGEVFITPVQQPSDYKGKSPEETVHVLMEELIKNGQYFRDENAQLRASLTLLASQTGMALTALIDSKKEKL